ncbi:hypothetical protein MN608_04349 [Microdochium nivale]|nr:hypothetical protein MN608_04349 [Microdochium nivale]
MKFCRLIAFLTAAATGIASASPTLDQRNHNSGLKHTDLPYGMKSPPDCKKWKEYCLGCNEDDFNCITSPVCEWCRENDASWDNGSSGGGNL